MPLPINIRELLHGKSVEWERLEFKEGWNPQDTLHTICAFANDFHNLGGGYIIVGIRDKEGKPDLPPIGLDARRFDAIQKEILNLGHSAIQPSYHPVVMPYEFDGRSILVIWAPGGQTRPYKARVSLGKGGKEYGYYIRKGSSTVRAKGPDENELLSLASTVPFDDRINQQASVEDISRELIRDFLEEVGSDLARQADTLPLEALGRQMNVIVGPGEAPFPINVGLLFFHSDPRRFFPATQIDVVWFPEGPGGDRFTEKSFSGPLHRMVREALAYIKRNYLNETVIKQPDRAEADRIENFPYAAVEEALVNAIYHRSYEEREPVEVRITPQELVVLSFPGPDRSVQLDSLRTGRAVSRRYRNRRIGEFLKELNLTEGRATGIPKILRAMKENGSPKPEFDTDDDRTFFLVRLPVHPQASPVPNGHTLDSGLQPESQPESKPDSLKSRILDILADGPKSKSEISALLGQKTVSGPLNKQIRKLLEIGEIEYTIPDKPSSRFQKYSLVKGKPRS